MKLKHIAIATLALVAGGAFASNIAVNTNVAGSNGGLMLAVTNTATGFSYDFDLGTTFNAFTGQITNAAFTQSWSLNDANWSSFTNGASSSDLVWTVFGGLNKGAISTAGNEAIVTTIENDLPSNTFSTSTQGSGGITQIVANFDKVAGDINLKSGSSSSFVAKSGTDISYFGDGTDGVALSGYVYNNKIDNFNASNAVGASSDFYRVDTTGKGKTANALAATAFAGQFTFNIGSNGQGSLVYAAATTPAVPEPSTYGLALVGVLLVGVVARRRA